MQVSRPRYVVDRAADLAARSRIPDPPRMAPGTQSRPPGATEHHREHVEALCKLAERHVEIWTPIMEALRDLPYDYPEEGGEKL